VDQLNIINEVLLFDEKNEYYCCCNFLSIDIFVFFFSNIFEKNSNQYINGKEITTAIKLILFIFSFQVVFSEKTLREK